MEWEALLIEKMQNSFGGLSMVLGKAGSFFGGETGMMLCLLLVMFCWKKETGFKLALMISAVNTWLPMIKAVVMRPRPYMEYPDRIRTEAGAGTGEPSLDVTAQGYSFPSIHSASVVSSYVTIAREAKKRWIWIITVVLILIVGVSRVMSGMHYPTDVLAGWALGLLVLFIFDTLERYVPKEGVRHLILFLVSILGLFYVRTQDYYTSLGLLIGVMAAIPFERRYVGYKDTRSVPAMILRVAGGVVLFYAINTVLKLPFDKEFLAGGSLPALLIRSVRYAVVMFVITGVYPKLFRFFEK